MADPGDVVQLPRWTSRFTLSAQKPGGGAGGGGVLPAAAGAARREDQGASSAAFGYAGPALGGGGGGGGGSARKGNQPPPSPKLHGTPGLGSARRVPVMGRTHAAGARGSAAKGMAATPPRRSAAASAAEQDSATPLACLFDRFNSLAVETGATAGKAAAMSTISERAGARMAIGATPAVQFPGLHGGACALPPPASVPRTPLGPARRVAMAPGASAASAAAVARGSSRVRVSFGTPVVHRYDSAPRRERTGAGDAAAGESPMPSTAGHTPYSRSGGRGSMRGGAAAGGRRGARSSGPAGVSPLGAPDFDGACIVEGDEAAAREEEAHVQAQLEVPVAADVASSTPAPGSAGFTFMRPPADQERTPAMKSRQPNSDGATPTLFGTCRGSPGPAHQPAGSADVVVPAAAFPPFTTETPAPKSTLRKPARVPSELPRPPLPSKELRALLKEGAPGPVGGLAVTSDTAPAAGTSAATPMLGSISRLSPVRASKKVQGSLGADHGQVLTPVRRSARKVASGAPMRGISSSSVAPMLEATNFCYEGNPVLTPAARKEG